jgi:hypothetical protein
MKILIIAALSLACFAGCSNPCEKLCDDSYDQLKTSAGGNFEGMLKKGAQKGLSQCKHATSKPVKVSISIL